MLTKDQAQRALGLAIYLHGKKCKYCGRTERPLELDHIDGNPNNNPPDGSNWAPACGPCNNEKGPRRGPGKRGLRMKTLLGDGHHKKGVVGGGGMGMGEGGRSNEEVRSKGPEMVKNEQYAPAFRRFAVQVVEESGEFPKDDLIPAACEYAGCTIKTGERYWVTLSSLAGPLEQFKNPEGVLMVRLRAQVLRPASGATKAAPSPKPPPTNGKSASAAKTDAARSILQSPGANR